MPRHYLVFNLLRGAFFRRHSSSDINLFWRLCCLDFLLVVNQVWFNRRSGDLLKGRLMHVLNTGCLLDNIYIGNVCWIGLIGKLADRVRVGERRDDWLAVNGITDDLTNVAGMVRESLISKQTYRSVVDRWLLARTLLRDLRFLNK